jgi:protein PhnA
MSPQFVFHAFDIMTHFICKGSCGGSLEEMGVCETHRCSAQWEMMEACDCMDGSHGKIAEIAAPAVKDSNGNVLKDGDTVVIIKDLKLRGSSTVLKVGTKASKIKLTQNSEEIDCRLDGTAIVLRCEFVKKIS